MWCSVAGSRGEKSNFRTASFFYGQRWRRWLKRVGDRDVADRRATAAEEPQEIEDGFSVRVSAWSHDCFSGSFPLRGLWPDSSNDSPANFSIGMPDARDNFSASTSLSTFHSLIHQ